MFEVKDNLTTANILKKVSEADIFKAYCKNFKFIGIKFSSELREDPDPSAIISEFGDRLWYKDFGEDIKSVDCFGYIMRKHTLSFLQALNKVNTDFNIGLQSYVEHSSTPIPVRNVETNNFSINNGSSFGTTGKVIIPIYRDWLDYDVKYWKDNYYIDLNRARYFDIGPVSARIIDDKRITLEFPSYCYYVDTEYGVKYYKFYSPFSKKFKWVSNCKSHHYLGMNHLPWVGEKVVITKSLKDVAVLSIFGLPAIAPQSEGQVISEEWYNRLKRRFKTLYILYDNDKAGVKGTIKTLEHYPDIIPIFVPEESGEKDISDYLKTFRYNKTFKLIKELFYED